MMDIDGPRQEPADGQPARAQVILLHGYGADGNDLIGLAPYWARELPHVGFVSPNAPFPCEMPPMGRQWFSLGDRSPDSMLAGARMAAQVIDGFIDDEMKRLDLTPDKIALVGFSQGTMMSLFVGPRRAEAIAGIVGFSGRLIGPELMAEEVKTKPPVTLVHGQADEMVPAAALGQAVSGLEAVGIEVASEMRPGLGHSIDEQGLKIGLEFLKNVLGG
jgi:phospholipase/carboxylesterase